ncbi:hypothetical protein LSAT2_023740 [Lamellibrachia satsuma]|nr:hypothetical protein LSAT2_023740 [Lamellibrachia satsuma]
MALKRKRAISQNKPKPIEKPDPLPLVRRSDEPVIKKAKWTNKERVLVFSSRGISYRDRHLMNDLRAMMPHSKSDSKMDRKDQLFIVNEICEMKNCRKCLFF